MLHHEAIKALVVPAPEGERRAVVERAAAFFNELLSPYEMSLRGYRAANDELRRMNEDLQQQKDAAEAANRELESFSYSVSHDLRTPLRSIDGFSQILIEDFSDALGDEGRRHLGRVREGAQQMSRLIDDLLGLARVTRTELHRTSVDLSGLTHSIAERLRETAPQRSCVFHIEDGVHADGDARLLAILLENLLGNAWKFTSKRDHAEITFRREERAGTATYIIRDNGAGFDMAFAAKLFGAFQRLHAAHEFEGTGIGLAIVQRVVHRHGGRIEADGTVDGGATFSFTLGKEREA
jgi:light-regulated signal transduction histidine kinase (bacteriophytochrome)